MVATPTVDTPRLFEITEPLVESKATTLSRNWLFRDDAREDISQNLWTIVIPRLPKYDPSRSRPECYAGMIVRTAGGTLVREKKRQLAGVPGRFQSLEQPCRNEDGATVELHETLIDRKAERQRSTRNAIEDGMEGAPAHLHQAVFALGDGNLSEGARRLRQDREKMRWCRQAIRERIDMPN